MAHNLKFLPRLARGTLAVTLAMGLAPATAWGDPQETTGSNAATIAEDISAQLAGSWEKTLEAGQLVLDSDPYDYEEGTASSLSAVDFPSSYDLREKGIVTPIKLQNPWGTCWGFSAIAAAETSILSELGTTYEQTGLDLSELQLAWFAATPLDESAGPQAGEGTVSTNPESNQRLNIGGMPFTATSIFASGIGPLAESDVPYKNAEGLTVNDPDGNPVYYSSEGDWSVSEDLRFASGIELEESSILPAPAGKDETGAYEYNSAATDAIKSELMEGRAVQIAFTADQSRPGQTDPSKYINTETWAHYTYEQASPTHGVTIVGWDDDYSKDNFLDGHKPPEDGAWIVKNSWGADTEEFPNRNSWGIDGEGYFYISYYDQSVTAPETLDFYTENLDSDREFFYVDAYDYMPSNTVLALTEGAGTKTANVFTASGDRELRAVSTNTSTPGTTVTYTVYRLTEDAKSPEDGSPVSQVTEEYEFGGYHRVDLPEPVLFSDGEQYSVVVELVKPSGNHEILTTLGLSKEGAEAIEQATGQLPSSYSNAVVNEGESFLLMEGEWCDWSEVTPLIEDGKYAIDNFSIKAYSDPVEPASTGFDDVSADDWFAGAVQHVSEIGAMTGYAGTSLFGPNDEMLRQDVASMLFKWLAPEEAAAAADPEVWQNIENSTGLSDVEDGQYYTAAVNWCFEKGLMTGYANANKLGVGDSITREQFASVLYRAFNLPKAGAPLNSFPDADQVSEWAIPAMAWATSEGIINGADGMLLPQNAATRAEVATMITNYDSRD